MSVEMSVLIVLFVGVLVGAAVPALLQLRTTLRAGQGFLEGSGKRLEALLGDLHESVARLNRVGTELEEALGHVREAARAVGDTAESIRQLGESVKTVASIGAAIGPAVGAAVSAFVGKDRAREEGTS